LPAVAFAGRAVGYALAPRRRPAVDAGVPSGGFRVVPKRRLPVEQPRVRHEKKEAGGHGARSGTVYPVTKKLLRARTNAR